MPSVQRRNFDDVFGPHDTGIGHRNGVQQHEDSGLRRLARGVAGASRTPQSDVKEKLPGQGASCAVAKPTMGTVLVPKGNARGKLGPG